MATEYFLYAGNELIEQMDVASSDRGFHNLIKEIKSELSEEAKKAFSIHCEYSVHEGEVEKSLVECMPHIVEEIKASWFE